MQREVKKQKIFKVIRIWKARFRKISALRFATVVQLKVSAFCIFMQRYRIYQNEHYTIQEYKEKKNERRERERERKN